MAHGDADLGELTPQSYLRQDPDWTPTYGSAGSFTMVDLLSAAGAVAVIP